MHPFSGWSRQAFGVLIGTSRLCRRSLDKQASINSHALTLCVTPNHSQRDTLCHAHPPAHSPPKRNLTVRHDNKREAMQAPIPPWRARRESLRPTPPPDRAHDPKDGEQVRNVNALAHSADLASVCKCVGVRPVVKEMESQR